MSNPVESPIRWAALDSPIGAIAVAWHDTTVVAVEMRATAARDAWDAPDRPADPSGRILRSVERAGGTALAAGADSSPVPKAFAAYFEGELGALDRLGAAPLWGTPFQRQIWMLLREIPAGSTCTYGQLGARAGRPGACRAVGGAVGANPVSLVLPCHRVVGASGRLTGFGGGLERKLWLLRHEGAPFSAPRRVAVP